MGWYTLISSMSTTMGKSIDFLDGRIGSSLETGEMGDSVEKVLSDDEGETGDGGSRDGCFSTSGIVTSLVLRLDAEL